jgi:hypothetical protein
MQLKVEYVFCMYFNKGAKMSSLILGLAKSIGSDAH